MKKKWDLVAKLKQFVCYFLGLSLIAVGINVSKVSALGISPVSSTPRALNSILGDDVLSLGVATWIIYAVVVLIQLVILGKKFKLYYLLELPLTIVFGWLVDFFGTNVNTFGHLLSFLKMPDNYFVRFAYLLISMVVIGIGVFLYLRPKWVSMPCEGLAAAVAERTGLAFGNCKTIVDSSLIVIALVLQLVFLGGFSSFSSDKVIVREGTVLSAVLIGQIVKFLAKKFGAKVDVLIDKVKKA